jgi:hypothetical protein
LSNKTYDFLKRLVQVILPALGTLYFSLAGIWDLPNSEKVVGSIVVLTTFLGVALGISSSRYLASDRPYDGNLVVTTSENGKTTYILELGIDPDEIESKSQIVFKTVDVLSPEFNDED